MTKIAKTRIQILVSDIFIFEDIDMALEYPGLMVLPIGAVEQGDYIMEHEFVHMVPLFVY